MMSLLKKEGGQDIFSIQLFMGGAGSKKGYARRNLLIHVIFLKVQI